MRPVPSVARPFVWGAWLALLVLPFGGPVLALATAAAIGGGGVLFGLTSRSAGLRRTLQATSASLDDGLAVLSARRSGWLAVCGVLLLGLPLFADNYVLDIAATAGIYVILALGLNLVVGQTGLLHLGYVAFYGIGAYTFALLSTGLNVSFWLGLPMGAATAALFGLALGLPVLRLRGDYLAIVTLGFGEVTRLVLRNWDEVTNGPNGIPGIGRPAVGGFVFDTPASFYFCVLALAVLTLFFMWRISRSRIGRAWIAIREDEIAARSVGIDTTRYKLLAFALGAGVAGMAGTVFASKMTFVSPESFTFFESVIILCMVILGGMGSLPGVVLGAVVLVVLPEALRAVSDYRMLLFGAAIVLLMIFRPQGLIGSRTLAYEYRPGPPPGVRKVAREGGADVAP